MKIKAQEKRERENSTNIRKKIDESRGVLERGGEVNGPMDKIKDGGQTRTRYDRSRGYLSKNWGMRIRRVWHRKYYTSATTFYHSALYQLVTLIALVKNKLHIFNFSSFFDD
jgi:hypothetical protein